MTETASSFSIPMNIYQVLLGVKTCLLSKPCNSSYRLIAIQWFSLCVYICAHLCVRVCVYTFVGLHGEIDLQSSVTLAFFFQHVVSGNTYKDWHLRVGRSVIFGHCLVKSRQKKSGLEGLTPRTKTAVGISQMVKRQNQSHIPPGCLVQQSGDNSSSDINQFR